MSQASCIYEGHVRHRRFIPVQNHFRYRVFMMYLDLAEFPTLFQGRWLWSADTVNLAYFRRRDHLGDPHVPLDQAVRDLVEAKTGAQLSGPIRLLTHLRYYGYCFNPVSFYFCYDPSGAEVEAIVAEVHNTPWGDEHCYVLPEADNLSTTPGFKRFEHPKAMHVSPFMPMEIWYDWRFKDPGESLNVHFMDYFQKTKVFVEKLPKKGGKTDYTEDFFGKEANLTVSGQLSAEMFCLALGDVYTFGPTFRAENSNTRRHAAEFWMIEPEMAFCDLEGNMDLGEELIKFLTSYVMDECAEDLELFAKWVDKNLMSTLENTANSDYVRLPYREAVDILLKSGQNFEYEVGFGRDLQTEHERYLTEGEFKKPVIVYDYPKTIKPFYMRLNDDNETVAAMDVLVPNIGEIIGGSQREERLEELEARLDECGMDKTPYWWYLESRMYGSVPHSGFGMGFERLLMLVTGIGNIRDVIPFPRTPNNLEF